MMANGPINGGSIHCVQNGTNDSAEELETVGSHSDSGSVRPTCECNDTEYVQRLRRCVQFHFMTPCEKYKARKRIPWKLMVQLVKILLVTLQVFGLGASRGAFVSFEKNTILAFKHLMFKNWDVAFETLPYPPAVGHYAIYNKSELIDHLNYAMYHYNITESSAIGVYGFPHDQQDKQSKSAKLCISSFKLGEIFPANMTYKLNPQLESDCVDFEAITNHSNGADRYDVLETLKINGIKLNINKVHKVELIFHMNGIHIREHMVIEPFDAPMCIHIKTTVMYDNTQHNGQMRIDMKLDLTSVKCEEESTYDKDKPSEYGLTVGFDALIIAMCAISFLTCLRSILKSARLMREVTKFFEVERCIKLDSSERHRFISKWYIMVMVADVLTICGSGCKIAIVNKQVDLYDLASMLLGSATILVWLGVLRYFEWFPQYNILLLTMKKAFPHVMRFMICAVMFYMGFAICGWLVLGPYHMKFETIFTSSECLFSLVNGDDMFVTFSIITEKMPKSVWLFSRVYLYLFISLFIYFILNIFISVIIDTYETIKHYSTEGFPTSAIDEFMKERLEHAASGVFLRDVSVERGDAFCSLRRRLRWLRTRFSSEQSDDLLIST